MTTTPLGPELDPTTLIAAMNRSGHARPALLDSADRRTDGWTFIMAMPFDEIDSASFSNLNSILTRWRWPKPAELPPFSSGAVGMIGYEMGGTFNGAVSTNPPIRSFPNLWFGLYSGCIAMKSGTAQLLVDNRLPGSRETHALLREAYHQARQEHRSRIDLPPMVLHPDITRDIYLNQVARIRDSILAGDVYQVNMTLRFAGESDAAALDVYRSLREGNPAPYGAYLDLGHGRHVLCSSPERLFSMRKGIIRTQPIKGTCRRGSTPAEDRMMAQRLLESAKDRAELLMIVDLERNDLSRICRPGTVTVPRLFGLESYETVHHLVADVEGRLAAETHAILPALFPGGSVTGAPKIRAMEIIDELEQTSRQAYTGSIGYADFGGNWDMNVAIRTIMHRENTYWYGTGGGITWDSDPEEEYREAILKGKALARALNAGVKPE